MDKNHVIAKLRAHEPELRAAGIVHLRLHGSKARGDDNPGSDTDLLADLDDGRRLTILDMAGIESRLEELLGMRVDLSLSRSLKEAVRRRAAEESVLVF